MNVGAGIGAGGNIQRGSKIGNVSIGSATRDEINRDETKSQEITKNTDTGSIDAYVEGGVLDLLTEKGREEFATNVKLAGDEIKEKIDIINKFIEKLNSETGSNITLIENKFEYPIAAPTIKKIKDSNGNEIEVISIGNGMAISDPDLVAELKTLNKNISDDFKAGKYDNILVALKNNKIITEEEYNNLKTGDTEIFANMSIEEKTRVLFMSEGLGLYNQYQKMSDGEDKKVMAAKLKDSFGIKIGDNEAQILDSLSKAKISRNLSYQYEIDETHIQSYIEELTFKNADSNLYKYSLETYTFSDNLQKLMYDGQKIFSERMKTELLYEKDGKKIYYKDLLDKNSPYFDKNFLNVEDREAISVKINKISNEIANQLYGTNSKLSAVVFDTKYLNDNKSGGESSSKFYYTKEKFEEGLTNGSNFYNNEGTKITDYNDLPDEFVISYKLGANSSDEKLNEAEKYWFNASGKSQASTNQHECGITGHCKQNYENMGQKISEFETIWIENYNGSYFKNQGGEKVYYFLQPKEQISYATEALHTLFNSSNYEHKDIYNYEEFRLKFQELQKKYEK